MNVLYIEDGAKDAELTRKHFMRDASNVNVTHVGTLEEALSYLAGGEHCDLLLTNLTLPDSTSLNIPSQGEIEEADTTLEGRKIEDQKVEMMGMLTNGVAHNLNNVLAGIAGYIELSREDLSDDSPVQEHLKMVGRAIQSGSELCRQILAYSGNDSVHSGRFDLNDLLHENSRLIRISLKQGTGLSLELADELPAVTGDKEQLKLVLLNLVLNAAGAICEDQGFITIRTGLMAADRDFLMKAKSAPGMPLGESVFLEVQDSGPVIPADELAEILAPSRAPKRPDRGLGLAAVHDAVIASGGALAVTSESGRGSTFRVVLPLADQPE